MLDNSRCVRRQVRHFAFSSGSSFWSVYTVTEVCFREKTLVPQLALDDSKCLKPSSSFTWGFRKAMKGSTEVVRWLVAAFDTGVSGHCRQLQCIFFNFTCATADLHVSTAVAKPKLSRLAHKHEVNCTIQARASIQRIEHPFLLSFLYIKW